MANMYLWEISEIQYWFFLVLGMGAIDFKSKWMTFLYQSYAIVSDICHWMYTIICICDVTIYRPTEFDDLFIRIVVILTVAGIAIKRVFMEFVKRKVMEVQELMKRNFERPEIKYRKLAQIAVTRNLNAYNKFVSQIYIGGLLTVYLFAVSPMFNMKQDFPLPVLFLTTFNGNMYYIVYMMQFLLIANIFISYACYDTLVWSYITRICIRLEIIKLNWISFRKSFPTTDFTNYIEGYQEYDTERDDDDDYYADLEDKHVKRNTKFTSYDQNFCYDKNLMMEVKKYMRYHGVQYGELMKETKMVESCFSLPFLIQMIGGSIVLSLLLVFVTLADLKNLYEIPIIVYSVMATLDLFLYCYYGTELEEKSTSLQEAVYGFPWYEIDNRTRKYFISVLQMHQNKLKFTAGGYDQVNLEGFLLVIRIAYNFLALLRSSATQ